MSIIANELTKKYGSFTAVDTASFTIQTGEIVGFLGPNGAGKTTTMKMLTGILKPTSGTAEINGFDVLSDPESVRKEIGFLPENNPLYLDLTVNEYLDYSARISGVKPADVSGRMDTMIQLCGLESVHKKIIGTLSKGYRQRVGLAQALVHNPSVLILDEPTTGLDPNQILEIRDLILNLGWPLEGVSVELEAERFKREDYPAYSGDAPYVNQIRERIQFEGPLTEEQKARLLKIAGKCPVHLLLEYPVFFIDEMVSAEMAG